MASKPVIVGSAVERVLPINLSAERSVLGAVIEDDSLLAEVAGLRCEDFSLSEHRRVFHAISQLRSQNSPIDYVLVAEKLGNTSENYVLVASLIDGTVTHPDHIAHHAEIVKRKSQLRRLLSVAEWITNVTDDSADPDLVIEEAIGKLEAIATAEVKG